ncbi:MAG: SUF system Fe-S cluster assembly protein [Deltaproteobacteria bacterium]|nr:SUF system Fe-S cluster assembly protein [Deltaproteobacteria bacterium]
MADVTEIKQSVIDVLKTVYDPEIPVDIYELGLVYDVNVEESGAVAIRMTLTSPMCPVAESLPPEVEEKVRGVPGVTEVKLDLVWEPPWSPSLMSEAARLELGME